MTPSFQGARFVDDADSLDRTSPAPTAPRRIHRGGTGGHARRNPLFVHARRARRTSRGGPVADVPPTRGRHRRRLATARRIMRGVVLAVLAAAVYAAWPASLGGRMAYVEVVGTSMIPTYQTGDLVVVRAQDT